LAAEKLRTRGWQLLFHDVEICGVQIDLMMRAPSGVLALVEVKSQGYGRIAHLPFKQKRRLFHAATFLAGFEPVEVHLALMAGAQLTLLPVD
jgi:Holliday junction resolvase-like predicted endonuclease